MEDRRLVLYSPSPEFVCKTEVNLDEEREYISHYVNRSSPSSERNESSSEDSLICVRHFTTETTTTVFSISGSLFCRDYLRGACSRENCQYRHFLTEEEFKTKVQFCHDYQNKGCTRTPCNFIHCTTVEQNTFCNKGILPQELLKKYNLDNVLVVPYLPKSPPAKKSRETFLTPGAKKSAFSNGLEEKKKLVSYPLDPLPPRGPPFQPPMPPQMVEPSVPPPPPHIMHAAQMAADAARPLPPLPIPHMHGQQVVMTQLGPMPQGPVNPTQDMMAPGLNVDFSKPPPSLAPAPVPQPSSADGRMLVYGPVENPAFRHGDMEGVGCGMSMSGTPQPPYIETGAQPQLGIKYPLSPQLMQPRPPPPPPPQMRLQQQTIIQRVLPGQEYASMDGSPMPPMNGGVVQTMQDGKILYMKAEARNTPQAVFQEQGDPHQPVSGSYPTPGCYPTPPLSAMTRIHSSFASQGLDEPEMKKPKLQDREVVRGSSLPDTGCKGCEYLNQSRNSVEKDYVALKAKFCELQKKHNQLLEDYEAIRNFKFGDNLSMNSGGTPQQTSNSPTMSHPQNFRDMILGPQAGAPRPEYQTSIDMRDYGLASQKNQAGQQHYNITQGGQLPRTQTALNLGVNTIMQTQKMQGGSQMAPLDYSTEYDVEAQKREYVISQNGPQISQAGAVTQYIRQPSIPKTVMDTHQLSQQIYRVPSQQTATNLSFSLEYPRSSHEQDAQKDWKDVGPKPPPPPPQAFAYRQQAYKQPVEQQMSQPQQMSNQQQQMSTQQQIKQSQMSRQQQEQINQQQQQQMNQQQQQMNQQQQMYQQQFQQQMQQQNSNNAHSMKYAQSAGSEAMYMQQHNVE